METQPPKINAALPTIQQSVMARAVRAETFAVREDWVIDGMGRSSQVRRVAVYATGGPPSAEPLCLRLIFQKRGKRQNISGNLQPIVCEGDWWAVAY